MGVKAYLRKPVDGEALIDLIKYNQPAMHKANGRNTGLQLKILTSERIL